MVFHPGSNPTILNDAVFNGPVYMSDIRDKVKDGLVDHDWLKLTVNKLLGEGVRKDEARKLLSPYAAAFMLGKAKKMSAEEFNGMCGTQLAASTYMRWMNPVFFDGEINFTDADINCYLTELRNMAGEKSKGENN